MVYHRMRSKKGLHWWNESVEHASLSLVRRGREATPMVCTSAPVSSYRRGHRFALVLCMLGLLSACSSKPVAVPSPPPASPPGRASELEGLASYYAEPYHAEPYHGRRTASGEVFDTYQALTAAHRTLPFHSMVRVTNKTNGRAVDVRINDRGPFIDGRVIDLSMRAARQIDLVGTGTAPVKLK